MSASSTYLPFTLAAAVAPYMALKSDGSGGVVPTTDGDDRVICFADSSGGEAGIDRGYPVDGHLHAIAGGAIPKDAEGMPAAGGKIVAYVDNGTNVPCGYAIEEARVDGQEFRFYKYS